MRKLSQIPKTTNIQCETNMVRLGCIYHSVFCMFWLHSSIFLLLSQTLMLVSGTTRPLLGCLWNFPSSYSGLAYATTSMVIHEIIPIILMSVTSLGSLYTLYMHGRRQSPVQDAPVIKRVSAEKRAAKVRKRRVTETYWNNVYHADKQLIGKLKCLIYSRPEN